jgi:hypothetical protein
MTAWRTVAHAAAWPPPPDWQDQLAARLGQRPRRIGVWAELAIYGALRCLDNAKASHLPGDVALRVASLRGPLNATRAAMAQCRDGLPMPFTFLQSQPSQMLAALSRHLAWQGDACLVVSRDRQALLALAKREAGPAGVLVGWVEEGPQMGTEWSWLAR